jgi:hypothetical protein
MDKLRQTKLVYDLLKRFGDVSIVRDYDSDSVSNFIEFADNNFHYVNLDTSIEVIGLFFELLEVNLVHLENGTLDQTNFVDVELKSYDIGFYETYSSTYRIDYIIPYKAPNVGLAEKLFGYEMDEGLISPRRENVDTEFVDEGLVSVRASKENVQETTKRIVRELINRKLNK